MTDPKSILLELNKNLNILQLREAKYGGAAPLELLNQIDDHKKAITLTKQVIAGNLDKAEWNNLLKPLLLAFDNGKVINIEGDLYISIENITATPSSQSNVKILKPFMAPDLPANFVQRNREFQQLKQLLLNTEREKPVAITATLRGAGGFGKTTLAIALCHDGKIKTAFNETVLWATLGENPDLFGALTKLYRALTNETPNFVDVEEGAIKFAEALQDRVCLLVIDDVWNVSNLKPFLRGGKRCARLVTTRLLDVAIGINAKHIDVDRMTPEESLELLTSGIDIVDRPPFYELAHRLGEWPLMLELANGALRKQIMRGHTPLSALEMVTADLKYEGFTVFDLSNAEERNQAISQSLRVSLNLLNESEQQRYVELAIFPEDIQISLSDISTLWETNETKTRRVCERLNDLSLLYFQVPDGTVQLHDVVRKVLAQTLKAPEKLHARIIENWGNKYELSSEYAWRWYTYHLHFSGRDEVLHDLLFDFDWIQAKLNATNAYELVRDLRYLPREVVYDLLRSALQLSMHNLGSDKTQLANQLYGRLISYRDNFPSISTLCNAIRGQNPLMLLPLSPSLQQAGGPLIQTLENSSHVFSVAVTKDGRYGVAGLYGGGKVNIWDLKTGDLVRTLSGHKSHVFGVDITPDDRYIVSGSYDTTLKKWNLRSGECELTLEGHTGSINAVKIISGGWQVLSGANDGTIKQWDLSTGQIINSLEGHERPVTSLSITPDERFIVSAFNDGVIKMWNLSTGELVHSFIGHGPHQSVEDIDITPDGKKIISVSQSWIKDPNGNTIKLWDLKTAELIQTITGHSSYIYTITVAPEGRYAVSGSYDNTLKIWDLSNGKCSRTLKGHSGTIRAVAITPDGRYIISGGQDSTVKVWNFHWEGNIQDADMHTGYVYAIDVTPDGRYAVTGGEDKILKVWDLRIGICLNTLTGCERAVRNVHITSDGRYVVFGEEFEAGMKVWDLATNNSSMVLDTNEKYRDVTTFSNKNYFFSIENSVKNRMKLWDLSTGDCKGEIELEIDLGDVKSVVLSPDQPNTLILGVLQMYGWSIWTLNLDTQECVQILNGDVGKIEDISLSEDGRYAAIAISGSLKDTHDSIEIWDLQTQTLIQNLRPNKFIRFVRISAQGKYVFAGPLYGHKKNLEMWNLSDETRKLIFNVEDDFFNFATSRDGSRVVVGETSGRVHLLELIDKNK